MCNSLIYACVTKLTFSLYIIPFVKGLRLIGVNCLFYTFRQGGYIHICMYIYDGNTSLYIYIHICRYAVCVFLFSVHFTSYVCTFFCLLFQMKLLVQHQRL